MPTAAPLGLPTIYLTLPGPLALPACRRLPALCALPNQVLGPSQKQGHGPPRAEHAAVTVRGRGNGNTVSLHLGAARAHQRGKKALCSSSTASAARSSTAAQTGRGQGHVLVGRNVLAQMPPASKVRVEPSCAEHSATHPPPAEAAWTIPADGRELRRLCSWPSSVRGED